MCLTSLYSKDSWIDKEHTDREGAKEILSKPPQLEGEFLSYKVLMVGIKMKVSQDSMKMQRMPEDRINSMSWSYHLVL